MSWEIESLLSSRTFDKELFEQHFELRGNSIYENYSFDELALLDGYANGATENVYIQL